MTTVMTTRHPDAIQRLDAAFPHEWGFSKHLLMATVVGSERHGTYVPKDNPHALDDVDIMGIIVPPRRYVYGLSSFDHWCPEVGGIGELDVVAYSIRKAAGLFLKGNPNIVGTLWVDDNLILQQHPIWEKWRDTRRAVLSERVYSAFSGYAYAQLVKLGPPKHQRIYGS